MPKIAIGLGSAMGIWTVSMGTTAISNGFGSVELKKVTFNPKIVKLTNAEDIKVKYTELPCIGSFFSGIEWKETSKWTDGISFSTNKKVEGCISVRWEKKTYDNDKWKGSWNLLWGMKSDVSGMIFSSEVRTKDGKAAENTFLYTLQQAQDKWTEVSFMNLDERIIEGGSAKATNNIVFPKEGIIASENGWDFDFDSKDVCSSKNGCESESPKRTSTSLNWSFIHGNKSEAEEATHAYSWIENINTWLFFGSKIKTYLSQVMGRFELVSPTTNIK